MRISDFKSQLLKTLRPDHSARTKTNPSVPCPPFVGTLEFSSHAAHDHNACRVPRRSIVVIDGESICRPNPCRRNASFSCETGAFCPSSWGNTPQKAQFVTPQGTDRQPIGNVESSKTSFSTHAAARTQSKFRANTLATDSCFSARSTARIQDGAISRIRSRPGRQRDIMAAYTSSTVSSLPNKKSLG